MEYMHDSSGVPAHVGKCRYKSEHSQSFGPTSVEPSLICVTWNKSIMKMCDFERVFGIIGIMI